MSRRVISALLALMVLTACGGTGASTRSTGQAAAPDVSGAAATTAAGGGAAGGAAPAGAGSAADAAQPAAGNKATTGGGASAAPARGTTKQTAQQFGRKVILNATLAVQVGKVDEAEQNVRALIQSLGGYILQSQTNGDGDHRSVHLTFKVPAERFDEALNALENKTFARKVLSRAVTGDDVTDEFVDTESRLRNLKATEARLLDFLKQAQTVDEALKVNEQLSALQGQIEQANGRLKYLSESTAFSTINLDLQPDIPFVVAQTEGWRPEIAASSAWHSLLAFAQSLADVAIVLAIWSPVWGILLLGALLAWRRLGRRPLPPQPSIQP